MASILRSYLLNQVRIVAIAAQPVSYSIYRIWNMFALAFCSDNPYRCIEDRDFAQNKATFSVNDFFSNRQKCIFCRSFDCAFILENSSVSGTTSHLYYSVEIALNLIESIEFNESDMMIVITLKFRKTRIICTIVDRAKARKSQKLNFFIYLTTFETKIGQCTQINDEIQH